MNGASEATLQELLQINQQMASALNKMAGMSAGGANNNTGGGANNPAKSASALGKAFTGAGAAIGVTTGLLGKALTPAIGAVVSGMNLLVKSGTTLFQNQMQLAQGAIAGTNSLADLTAGLEQLPGILGFAMKAYNYQVKVLETNLKTFQALSDTGATLGGNLTEVRDAAKGMYLSMDEFARVMKNNASVLLNLGTTADDGARALIKFNSTMIKGDIGRQIMGMGYTAEQANNMLGLMSATMGGVTADQIRDQRGMEKSVKAFAEELSLSAELEGKSREEKEKEMKERAQNAVRENMLSKMSREEREAFIQAENRANAIGGKGARDALLAATLGLPPMTKEAQIFAATNQKANQAVTAMTGAIKDNTLSEADRQKRINQLYGEGAKAAADNAAVYGQAGVAIAMKGGQYADAMNANLKAETQARNQNMKSAEDFVKREEKARENLTKAQEGEAGAVAQRQAAAKYAGEELMNALYKAFKPLIDIVLKANEAFLKYLPVATQFAADVIGKGVGFIKEIFAKVDWGQVKDSFMMAWNSLSTTFGGIYDAIKSAFGGQASDIGKTLQTVFGQMMAMISSLADGVGFVVKLFAQSPLFQTLKDMMAKLWDLIGSLVDAVVSIVKSPLGTFLIKGILEIFNLFGNMINAIIDGVRGVIDVITGIVKFISGDFQGGFETIKKGLGSMLSGLLDFFLAIPKYIIEQTKNVWDLMKEAITGVLKSIVDGIKALGTKVVNFFTGGSKAESNSAVPATPSAPTASAPSAANMPPMTSEAARYAAQASGNTTPVTPSPTNANTPAAVQPRSNDPIEILRAEIQTLNSITSEMLRAMRDTRDYTRSAANTLASNGNLFKRA